MASEKVSALTEASNLTPNDSVYVVQDNVSKKAPIDKLRSAIKLKNVYIAGLGYVNDSTAADGFLWLFEKDNSLDPKVQIGTDSIDIRGETIGPDTIYHPITWEQLLGMTSIFQQSDDAAEINVRIQDTHLEVENIEHPQEQVCIHSNGFELYNASGQYINLLFPTLKELSGLAPGGSGKIASNGGYYINPSVKNPEGVVVELYQLDTQTSQRTDTLIQGAKYRSDGIEYYNGNGSIGWAAGADIAALNGLGRYTSGLATLLQNLDDRITALENA